MTCVVFSYVFVRRPRLVLCAAIDESKKHCKAIRKLRRRTFDLFKSLIVSAFVLLKPVCLSLKIVSKFKELESRYICMIASRRLLNLDLTWDKLCWQLAPNA